MGVLHRLKAWAKQLMQQLRALALAMKMAETPWYAKAWIAVVIAYALSPIDLIPDFVPVIGLVDDLILLPVGVIVARKLVPDSVFATCMVRVSDDGAMTSSGRWIVAGLIVSVWIVVGVWIWFVVA